MVRIPKLFFSLWVELFTVCHQILIRHLRMYALYPSNINLYSNFYFLTNLSRYHLKMGFVVKMAIKIKIKQKRVRGISARNPNAATIWEKFIASEKKNRASLKKAYVYLYTLLQSRGVVNVSEEPYSSFSFHTFFYQVEIICSHINRGHAILFRVYYREAIKIPNLWIRIRRLLRLCFSVQAPVVGAKGRRN